MNKQEFFTLIVETAIKHYTNPVVGNNADSGAHFCVVTENNALKFMSLNQDVMDEIFNKFVSHEVTGGYDFRPFIIPNNESGGVIFVEKISGDMMYDDYTFGGLDTLEILVDTQDTSKYLIVNEGDEIANTSSMVMNIMEDKCVFDYNDTSFELNF